MSYKTDIQIAREAKKLPIQDVKVVNCLPLVCQIFQFREL